MAHDIAHRLQLGNLTFQRVSLRMQSIAGQIGLPLARKDGCDLIKGRKNRNETIEHSVKGPPPRLIANLCVTATMMATLVVGPF